MLNRSVVILRPARPFIEWASSLPGPAFDESDQADEVAYLLPPYESAEEAEQILREAWPMLFESELNGWHTDAADWPRGRDFSMFQKWFKVELHSMVVDLCADKIIDEQDD
ncbi:MAG: hypothetical protein ACYTG6_13290 [Planctomycetota bacterium]|jgi:hypothetical protein